MTHVSQSIRGFISLVLPYVLQPLPQERMGSYFTKFFCLHGTWTDRFTSMSVISGYEKLFHFLFKVFPQSKSSDGRIFPTYHSFLFRAMIQASDCTLNHGLSPSSILKVRLEGHLLTSVFLFYTPVLPMGSTFLDPRQSASDLTCILSLVSCQL